MTPLTKSLLLICCGILVAPQQVAGVEPDSPAMVRVVNLVGPTANIVSVLRLTDDTPIPLNPKTLKPLTEQAESLGPEIELKVAPYSSFGDYVSVAGNRAYLLDVEGTVPGKGEFGAEQTIKLQAGHHYALLLWGTVNVHVIDQEALFPFEDERLANVVLLSATNIDSDTNLANVRHFVFGDDDGDSGQFAFTLQSKSFAGILRGNGGRANVLEAFQTKAGKLPLRVADVEDAVLVNDELTLVAKETHYVVVIGKDKAPQVVFIANNVTQRLGK